MTRDRARELCYSVLLERKRIVGTPVTASGVWIEHGGQRVGWFVVVTHEGQTYRGITTLDAFRAILCTSKEGVTHNGL